MQALQRFYARKGWASAPHLFVAPDGIWLFCPLKDLGIHAGTGNSGTSDSRFWYSMGLEVVALGVLESPHAVHHAASGTVGACSSAYT